MSPAAKYFLSPRNSFERRCDDAVFHPEFPKDINRYRERYAQVSTRLGSRFAAAVDAGIERIKSSPTSAGHYLHTGSMVVREFRRLNLVSFPFFILYGVLAEEVVVGSLIPTASDPLTWLARFQK